MADKRKLVSEMEKCFKKIDEGVEIFEETMSKLDEVNSDNQREKIQDELKKEIKKLQRLREQVKNWQGSSDIKDKEKLTSYRRLIEQRMETFKGIEREFKTKPHSNQGLSTEEKLDPKEKEKAETVEWLNDQIRAIQDDIDRTESKIESFSTADVGKKRGKAKGGGNRADKEELEKWNMHLERVKFHLENLEVGMRMIMNNKLEVEFVNAKLREPLNMYIDALESECYEELSNLEPDDVYEELGLGDYISQLAAIVPVVKLPELKVVSESNPSEVVKPALPKSISQASVDKHVPQPKVVQPTLGQHTLPKSLAKVSMEKIAQSNPSQPLIQPSLHTVAQSELPKPKLNAVGLQPSSQNTAMENYLIVSSDVVIKSHKLARQKFIPSTTQVSSQLSNQHSPVSQPMTYNFSNSQPSIHDDSFIGVGELTEPNHLPMQVSSRLLPSWLPKKPPFDVDLDYFTKLELGTLFFSFYYMESTKSQLLAATTLKNMSWRFHTRYLMWFRRKDEPVEITAIYERGAYYYFDYEQWSICENDDFVFEYQHLEDNL